MALNLSYSTLGANAGPIGLFMPLAAANDVWIVLVETANQWLSAPVAQIIVDEGPPAIVNDYTMTAIGNIGTGTAGGTAATAIRAYGFRCAGGESQIVVPDQGDHQIALAAAFTGAKLTGTPWALGASAVEAAATASMSIPGFTSTRGGSLIMAGCAIATDTATEQFPAGVNASLTSFSKVQSLCSTVGNGGGLAMYIGRKATPGLVDPTTGTLVGASVQASLSLEIFAENTSRRVGMRWL